MNENNYPVSNDAQTDALQGGQGQAYARNENPQIIQSRMYAESTNAAPSAQGQIYSENDHTQGIQQNQIYHEISSIQPNQISAESSNVQASPISAESSNVQANPISAESSNVQASPISAESSNVQANPISAESSNMQANQQNQINAQFIQPNQDYVNQQTPYAENANSAFYSQGNVPYDIPLLQINDLCKRYPGMGNYMSVFHMNLTIPRGRIIGLLGPNGCGKSTLIKMINGLLAPTSGTVLINGMNPCAATKRVISYLPERTYLDNSMKVTQMVEYFADFYEDFSKERAYNMLQALGININARLKTLSKGTKEKVQLILVMSRQADLYILDEPIAGVDPAARDYILRTIITNYNPGSTIILSTHLISDIENILDDVIFMKNGSLMLYTSVDSIRSQMGKSVDTYFREVYAC